MSAELKNELIMAKDYHSHYRKTRKRKSAPVKEKMSPKKDKEMGKANVTVKK
jgi:bacterioferritin (cytochrome b1)